MSALAHAVKIEDIEEGSSLIDAATKTCFTCDEDNPRAVLRSKCPRCMGSGREPLSASVIASELRASKKRPKLVPADDDSDLFLDY